MEKKKVLSIIIPRFNETERDMLPLLSSINNQAGVDLGTIEVIIVNDAGTPLYERSFTMYDVLIRVINLEKNGGSGVARQAGLDAAKGDYVMFCDADDVLHNVGVLGLFLAEIQKTGADYLSSAWLEELKVIYHYTGEPLENKSLPRFTYINHEMENTWMHGKVFNRLFLMENGIRFDDELRVHEDTYFLSLARAFAKNPRYIPVTTYVWKWHPNSITRRDDAIYRYSAFPTFIEACLRAEDKIAIRLEDVEGDDPLLYKIVQFVIYCFFSFLDENWQDKDKREYYEKSLDVFRSRMVPYWRIWDRADEEYIGKIYAEERNKNYAGIEPVNLFDWVKQIRQED